jgi:hypothetical protein
MTRASHADGELPDTPEWGETGDAIAQRAARALVGESATGPEMARWRDALRAHDARLPAARDRALWRLMCGAPWLIGLIDAGLALSEPHSPVRLRLYLMLAVLEASPTHAHRFLPRATGALTLPLLAVRGVIAVLRAACGLALVRVLGLAWR